MRYTNANVFLAEKGFVPASFCVEGGVFTALEEGRVTADGAVDLDGAYVIPGLIDIHTHGNSGADFSDGDYEGLRTMAAFLAGHGVTGFAPTSMALPYEVLGRAYATARRLADEAPAGCARLLGINMEGPFFSEKKKGAQNAAYLRSPDFEAFRKLYDDCGGLIRIVDLAPELPGAADFAAKASKLCTGRTTHGVSSLRLAR